MPSPEDTEEKPSLNKKSQAINGAQGSPVRVNTKWRDRFYLAMHSKMLPQAERILMGMLRSKHKEDKKWAVQIVIKKTIPDEMMNTNLGNTLAELLEKADHDKAAGERLNGRQPKKKLLEKKKVRGG